MGQITPVLLFIELLPKKNTQNLDQKSINNKDTIWLEQQFSASPENFLPNIMLTITYGVYIRIMGNIAAWCMLAFRYNAWPVQCGGFRWGRVCPGLQKMGPVGPGGSGQNMSGQKNKIFLLMFFLHLFNFFS